ncbi:MAG: hypothetical protein DI626_11125, partial [Micavibrio aeruginosavorus]
MGKLDYNKFLEKMTQSSASKILKLLPAKAPAMMKEFSDIFLQNVSEEDLKQITPDVMAKTLESHWDLFKAKKKNKPSIRIYTPSKDKDGYTLGRTVIDIVQDDMAFLVDSVVAEIVRHGQLIQTLIHPTIHVEFAKGGEPKKFIKDYQDGVTRYSMTHIELRSAITDAQI